jgi:hypothetical protein
LSHHFSNPKRIRESIRQLAAKREWKDLPVSERIQILEEASKAVEQVMEEVR